MQAKDQSLREHVRQLNMCNQRGGRMLSLTDLLEAGTVDLDLGAYLAAAMRGGASLMVGANPGGAGKTTVMAALLNWLPNPTQIIPVASFSSLDAISSSPRHDASSHCVVAHEVGSGGYFAYVWGEEARRFFGLPRQGFSIATNLHADTLSDARHQLLRVNGVEPTDLDAVTLKVFLKMERTRGWQTIRTVSRVYENDGAGDRLIWAGNGQGAYLREADSAVVDSGDELRCRQLLALMERDDIKSIEQVRRVLLDES